MKPSPVVLISTYKNSISLLSDMVRSIVGGTANNREHLFKVTLCAFALLMANTPRLSMAGTAAEYLFPQLAEQLPFATEINFEAESDAIDPATVNIRYVAKIRDIPVDLVTDLAGVVEPLIIELIIEASDGSEPKQLQCELNPSNGEYEYLEGDPDFKNKDKAVLINGEVFGCELDKSKDVLTIKYLSDGGDFGVVYSATINGIFMGSAGEIPLIYGISNADLRSVTDRDADLYTGEIFGGDDCNDLNAEVRPDQTNWFMEHSGDGSFDYNCDAFEESRYPYIQSCNSGTLYDHSFDTVTDCGESGVLMRCVEKSRPYNCNCDFFTGRCDTCIERWNEWDNPANEVQSCR
jgi:hypothetical protein